MHEITIARAYTSKRIYPLVQIGNDFHPVTAIKLVGAGIYRANIHMYGYDAVVYLEGSFPVRLTNAEDYNTRL